MATHNVQSNQQPVQTDVSELNSGGKIENDNSEQYIDDECFNEDLEESDFCEKIYSKLNPTTIKNNLPFPLYMKDNFPIIFEALIELERVRPKDPVEFFSVYILQKYEKIKKEQN